MESSCPKGVCGLTSKQIDIHTSEDVRRVHIGNIVTIVKAACGRKCVFWIHIPLYSQPNPPERTTANCRALLLLHCIDNPFPRRKHCTLIGVGKLILYAQ